MSKKNMLELTEYERAIGSTFTKVKLETFIAQYLADTEGYDTNKAIDEAQKIIKSGDVPFKFMMQINEDD